jgi:hypothetical protein|eukprot:Stramenopile-MAST_4_protein_1182
MSSLTEQRLHEAIECLDETFENSYALYDQLGKLDQVLNNSKGGLDAIIKGTSGLSKVIENFLVPEAAH